MGYSITICHEEVEGFEIDQCKRQEPCSMNLYHYHSSYEIYYLLTGVRNYFIKDRTYRVEKGDLVLINRNDLHKTTYGGSLTHERILVNFKQSFIHEIQLLIRDIDLLQPFCSDIHVVRLDRAEQSLLEQALFRMMKEAKEKAAGWESLLKLDLLELLIFITRCAVRDGVAAKEQLNQMHEKISEVVKYINERYMDRLTLQLISGRFYISPCYLSRLFKNVTGFTFTEYLSSIRVKEAQRLLKESDLNMGEIAERTGFESSTHFGRVFKEITGFPPLRFRKISKT